METRWEKRAASALSLTQIRPKKKQTGQQLSLFGHLQELLVGLSNLAGFGIAVVNVQAVSQF